MIENMWTVYVALLTGSWLTFILAAGPVIAAFVCIIMSMTSRVELAYTDDYDFD